MLEGLKRSVLKSGRLMVVLIAAVAASASATAGAIYTLIDLTDPRSSFSTFNRGSYTGQSFSVSTPSVLSGIGLSMINMNVDAERSDKYLTFELLSGDGINGALIGQSTVNVDSVLGNSQNSSVVDFFQLSNIYLEARQYTFRFIGASMRYGFASTFDVYSGGRGYWFDPLVDGGKNNDMRFRVLLSPASSPAAPIPIPAPPVLIALGLVVMYVQRRMT